MAIKVGINGYGRIGRNVLRALYESGRTGDKVGHAFLPEFDSMDLADVASDFCSPPRIVADCDADGTVRADAPILVCLLY